MTKLVTRAVKIPFSGFYASEHRSNIDMAIEDYFDTEGTGAGYKLIPEEFYMSFNDTRAIEREYCKLYLDGVESLFCGESGIDVSFRFKDMTSPREYNFETDRLFADITLKDVKKLKAYVTYETLEKAIKANHTSYDGFISFYSNNINNWNAKPLKDWDHNEIGTLLEAAMLQAGMYDRNDDMAYAIMEPALCNGRIDSIAYPYLTAWEAEHPQEYRKACDFLGVEVDAYNAMPEEEQAALLTQYKEATYHCPKTLELPL